MDSKAGSALITVVLAVLTLGTAVAQQSETAPGPEPELSARELFRNAVSRLRPTTVQTSYQPGSQGGGQLPTPTVGPDSRREQTAKPKEPKSRPPKKKASGSQEVSTAKKAKPPKKPSTHTPPARPPQDSASQHRPPASSVHKTLPLGLRYRILKQVSGNKTREVSPDTVFRSGDRIRLEVMSSTPAYLYIVAKGSSGQWSVLFPNPEIQGGNNYIEFGHAYEIPRGHWFAFDEQVGEERLFVMLSREPQEDLEELIYDFEEPASEEPAEESDEPVKVEKVMMAADIDPVDDSLISQLRHEVYARDLVFEKVDEEPGEDGEKAVYVVNKTGKDDSRVIADVVLEHR